MKRNSATLLKYILYAGVFLTVGPMALKFSYAERDPIAPVVMPAGGGHGMPIDPDILKAKPPTVSTFIIHKKDKIRNNIHS
jgi:hypothetical protein